MDVKFKIGLRIKTLRNNKCLSQSDLAFFIGMDRSYLAGIESGKRNVSIMNIEKIATALEMSLCDFFDDLSFKEVKELR